MRYLMHMQYGLSRGVGTGECGRKVRPKFMSLFRRTVAGDCIFASIFLLTLSAPTGDVCRVLRFASPHPFGSFASFMAESFCRCRATKHVSHVETPDFCTPGCDPKYNLSFWSNEFGKGSSQLEKFEAYFQETLPAQLEFMQKFQRKCYFCFCDTTRGEVTAIGSLSGFCYKFFSHFFLEFVVFVFALSPVFLF